LIVKRTDKDQRYTFTDAGTYTVKLTVSNSICSYSDSITVITSVSEIYVPNVFTPNGDGFNDEFRVAYNSLISFQCWVYNRWGRQVYYWNDPTKGWDGNINGKKAVPGAYFYIIKAVGSDKKVYKLKGDINLLR
jgi:gliding motility-associated-like protein